MVTLDSRQKAKLNKFATLLLLLNSSKGRQPTVLDRIYSGDKAAYGAPVKQTDATTTTSVGMASLDLR
jgi:hypothetical protein